jgi:hypothetical protein
MVPIVFFSLVGCVVKVSRLFFERSETDADADGGWLAHVFCAATLRGCTDGQVVDVTVCHVAGPRAEVLAASNQQDCGVVLEAGTSVSDWFPFGC